MGRDITLSSKPGRSSYRLINAVVILCRVAKRYGISKEELLAGSGIEPKDISDPYRIVTITQEMIVGRNLVGLVQVPWMGLEVGRDYHYSANGKLGMAMMCCETGLEALRMAMAYPELLNSYHHYDISLKQDTARARLKEIGDLGEYRHFICELEMASMQSMAINGLNVSRVFREIYFPYPEPAHAQKYREFFGCRIFFDSPQLMCVLDRDLLNKPMLYAHPLLKKDFEQECHRLSQRLADQETVSARIYRELELQNDNYPTLDNLARRINMAPRTIRRHLRAEKTSYRELLSRVRKNRAIELLSTSRLSVEEVASRLGFNNVSSFYRAFSEWTGSTPRSFRE